MLVNPTIAAILILFMSLYMAVCGLYGHAEIHQEVLLLGFIHHVQKLVGSGIKVLPLALSAFIIRMFAYCQVSLHCVLV